MELSMAEIAEIEEDRAIVEEARSLRRLRTASMTMIWSAVLVLVGGVIAGIVVATSSATDADGYTDWHPYVGAGVGMIFGSAFLALLIYFLGSWGRAYATRYLD